MDDNNNQGNSGKNPELPFNQLPNQNPNGQENTYWENGNVSDNSTQQQSAQTPESATQFYQFYQEQMNGSTTPVPPTMVPVTPPKKKSHKKLVAAIITLVLVLSLAGTAFAFQDTLMNSLALMTKSPDEYYAYVEKKSMEASIEKLTPSLNVNQDIAYEMSMDVTYDRETVDSLLQTALGTGIGDIESMIGIPLERLSMDGIVASKNGDMYESFGLSLNQVDIVTFEILMNTLNQEFFMRIPELSPAYLRQSLDTGEFDSEKYTEQLKLLTPERTADFLKRYTNIIADNMNEVELSKNEEVSVDALTANCTKLSITVDNESLYDITSAILKEAKEDEYIYDLLPLFEVSESEFKDAVDEAQDSLKDSLESEMSDDSSLEMNVYVNDRGEIIGRDFEVEEDGNSLGSFGYMNLGKNNSNEFSLYYEDMDGNKILEGNGTQTKKDGAYTGEIELVINDPTGEFPSEIGLEIEYEDVKTEIKNNRYYQYGTYTISSPLAYGLTLVVENNVEDDVQQCKMSVQMGSSPLLTIDTKAKYLEDFTIPSVSENEEIYDFTDYETYLSTVDIEAFISNLSEKLGVDLQSLIDNFMYY
jgi:hypothetical protein